MEHRIVLDPFENLSNNIDDDDDGVDDDDHANDHDNGEQHVNNISESMQNVDNNDTIHARP